ncbi:MAG: hypothetical protein J3K34DRAFT_165795 [Monoraphidium minutum]|nr:MAG: hypothetical protein J3K34DRAFT_165795 [Monoraphidium minutum]
MLSLRRCARAANAPTAAAARARPPAAPQRPRRLTSASVPLLTSGRCPGCEPSPRAERLRARRRSRCAEDQVKHPWLCGSLVQLCDSQWCDAKSKAGAGEAAKGVRDGVKGEGSCSCPRLMQPSRGHQPLPAPVGSIFARLTLRCRLAHACTRAFQLHVRIFRRSGPGLARLKQPRAAASC